MRHNLSSGSLNTTTGTHTGGLRFNLSSNSLDTASGNVNAPSSRYAKYLYSSTKAYLSTRFLAPAPPTAPAVSPTLTSTSRPKIAHDMLPANSRFAQRAPQAPAPAEAILVSAPPEPSASSNTRTENKSLLGGLFGGKPKGQGFSLLSDTSPNPNPRR